MEDEDRDNGEFNMEVATILAECGGESGGEAASIFVSANGWLLP